MKRIIDGVTYNTLTSTRLARSEYDSEYNHQSLPCRGMLYQSRGGAYFVVETFDLGVDEETGLADLRHRFDTMTAEQAHKWIMTGETEVYHNPFDEPPEATAEQEQSATIYVRVPVSLKQRLDQAAKTEGTSGNAWSIRCIERCLTGTRVSADVRTNIGLAWWLARKIQNNAEGFTEASLRMMGGEIASILERHWKNLGLSVVGFDQDISALNSSENYQEYVLHDFQRETDV